MALWQVYDNRNGTLEDTFDDGLCFWPWEAGFTTAHIEAYAGAGNYGFMGVPCGRVVAGDELPNA